MISLISRLSWNPETPFRWPNPLSWQGTLKQSLQWDSSLGEASKTCLKFNAHTCNSVIRTSVSSATTMCSDRIVGVNSCLTLHRLLFAAIITKEKIAYSIIFPVHVNGFAPGVIPAPCSAVLVGVGVNKETASMSGVQDKLVFSLFEFHRPTLCS